MQEPVEYRWQSAAVRKTLHYTLALPGGPLPPGGWPLLLLLHGLGRDHRTVTDQPEFPAWFRGRRFALLCPQGETGWYYDSPVDEAAQYGRMLRELLDLARARHPLTDLPARTGIAGWSMGGYGAMRFAETYPELVSAVVTTIGVLDFPSATLPSDMPFGVPALFGAEEMWPAANPLTGVTALRGKAILLLAAREAYDFPMNERFHAGLSEAGIEHKYETYPGEHVWSSVAAALPRLFDFMDIALNR